MRMSDHQADVRLDHTIIPARDKHRSARFFTDVFGLPGPVEAGFFVQVRLSDGRLLDFAEPGVEFPGSPYAPSLFEAGFSAQAWYESAFDAWAVAKDHIHQAWTRNTDPANLSRPVPKVMRDAADIIRRHGVHLGDQQDALVTRLEAPYAPRIQRAIRAVVTDESLTGRQRADGLLSLADQLGLVAQAAPEPLPSIEPDDIHLICWTLILPED